MTEIEARNVKAGVAGLVAIVKDAVKSKARPVATPTKKSRGVEWTDPNRVASRRAELARVLAKIPERFGGTNLPEGAVPTEEQINSFYAEYESLEQAQVAITARIDQIKEQLKEAVTSKNLADGVEDPDVTPGEFQATAFGRRFVREGGGRQDPEIDGEQLRELLGDDWARVSKKVHIKRQIIPAQVYEEVDEEALLKHLESHPEQLEIVRRCVVLGDKKSVRFAVRDIK